MRVRRIVTSGLRVRSSGEVGHGELIGARSSHAFAINMPISTERKQVHRIIRLSIRQFDGFLVQNECALVSPGRSDWCAIFADQLHLLSRSCFSGYPMPLPLPGLRIA